MHGTSILRPVKTRKDLFLKSLGGGSVMKLGERYGKFRR